MLEMFTAGSLTLGLAGPLTSLQLTHTVHHLGMGPPGTRMLLKVGIPMQRQAGSLMPLLVEHPIRHQHTHLLMVHRNLKHLHPGRHSQVQHLAEGLSTAVTHMLHCSETLANDNCISAYWLL